MNKSFGGHKVADPSLVHAACRTSSNPVERQFCVQRLAMLSIILAVACAPAGDQDSGRAAPHGPRPERASSRRRSSGQGRALQGAEPEVRTAPGLDAWVRLKAYLHRTLGG